MNAAIDPSQTSLDTKKIEDVLGAQGASNAGVYRVVIGGVGRAEDLAKGLRAAFDQTRHDVIQAK